MIQNVKKILAPIDFSEYSMEALRGAMELPKDVDGELHIVHVVAPHFALLDKMREQARDPEGGGSRRGTCAHQERRLRKFRQGLHSSDGRTAGPEAGQIFDAAADRSDIARNPRADRYRASNDRKRDREAGARRAMLGPGLPAAKVLSRL